MDLFLTITGLCIVMATVLFVVGCVKYINAKKNTHHRKVLEAKGWMYSSIMPTVLAVILLICTAAITKEEIPTNDYILSFKCSKVKIAEYSDTQTATCYNGDGASYVCTEVDYWTAPVSEVLWTQMRTNSETKKHELRYTNAGDYGIRLLLLDGGLLIPGDPPVMWTIPDKDCLDNIVVNATMEFAMNIKNSKGEWVTKELTKNQYFRALADMKKEQRRVIERLGDFVITNKAIINE